MRVLLGLSLVSLPAALAAQGPVRPASPPARAAQAQDAGQDDAGDTPDIVVTGSRTQPGAVIGDIPPEQQLSPADIRSYGVSSLSDLLTELAPQTRSDRGGGGAPVVLLNGRRIGSFAEIRDIPTEAIQRVDILPEEVALKYGYRADQRVVNVVLRRRFRAVTTEGAAAVATEGARVSPDAQVDLLHINSGRRFNLHLRYQESNELLESDRGIVSQPNNFSIPGNVVSGAGTVFGVPAAATNGAQPASAFFATPATVTDPARYRTLLPATSDFSANTVYATAIGKVTATLNARLQATDSTSKQGLVPLALALPQGSPFNPFGAPVTVDRALSAFTPLEQNTHSVAGHLGVSFGGDLGKWRWSLLSNYDRTDTRSFTETGVDATALQAALDRGDPTANPFAAIVPGALVGAAAGNNAYSRLVATNIDALASGPIVQLPAGPLSTSVRVGGAINTITSDSTRFGLFQAARERRGIVNAQANVDIPITSRRTGFLDRIGDLSANVNLAVDQLSDFGTLTTVGYGANWSPIVPLRFIASVTDQRDAPTQNQLGDPQITTPGVRVFDFVTGQSVAVTRVTGGNPLLARDDRHVVKFGLTAKPFGKRDLTFTANYIRARTNNPIAVFPSATAAITAAFPDRFTRDASGTLTRVDARPINFARSDTEELRYGFDFSIPLKSKLQKQFEAFRAGTGPNPFAGLFPPGRGPGGFGGGPGGERSPGAAPTTGAQGAPGAGGPGGERGGPGGGGGGFRGGGGFGGRGQAGGRLQFALYHTWHFRDTVLVRQGGPLLDALNGDVIGASGGGQARHELEGQFGYANNGIGVRLSGNYQTGTQVNGFGSGATGSASGTGALNFGSLSTFDLRLFADVGQQLRFVRKHPWARGVRVTAGITNLFDTRQRVTDATGAVPFSYQPDYLDPLGRTVRISLRKLFF